MRKKLVVLFLHIEIILICLIVLFPVIWIVLSAFQSGAGLTSASFGDQRLTLNNYVRLFTETKYVQWFINTLKIAVINTILSVFLIMITAWIMSRFQFRGKKPTLLSILLLSMFPTFLSMTALYTLFLSIGLLGNPLSLIIVYAAGAIPYNTWLVKGYLDGIPRSIDEASHIDGCTKIQSFVKIILPLSRPIITYCAVSQFMWPWMDYILPSMLLRGEKSRTVAVGLYGLIADSRDTSNFKLFAAGALLIAIPITILFVFFQKYLAQGIAAGADKG